MPQINQLPDIFISQLFWLAVVFGIIYFWIGRGLVPKIQSVVEDRDKKIADDLAAAQRAREQAEASEEAYRERIDASRSEAMKVAQDAKHQAALDTEKRLKAVDAKIGKKVAEAETKIRAAAGFHDSIRAYRSMPMMASCEDRMMSAKWRRAPVAATRSVMSWQQATIRCARPFAL